MNVVVLSIALIVLFAAFLAAHAALAIGLIRNRSPWWHGLLVILPPLAWLAPYWGRRAGLNKRTWFWVGSLAAYIVVRVLAAALV
jgi:hypothetical protein